MSSAQVRDYGIQNEKDEDWEVNIFTTTVTLEFA